MPSQSLRIRQLSYACKDTDLICSINAHLRTIVLTLITSGTEEHNRNFLPGLSNRSIIGANAMGEPNNGSDVFNPTANARRDGSVYILNGHKIQVTNSPVANLMAVHTTVNKSKGARGVTGFRFSQSMTRERGPILVGKHLAPDREKPLPIGIACENIEAFAVDDQGLLITEPDKEGELWIRGSCVAQGYWGDPAKTAKSFVPNPFQTSFAENATVTPKELEAFCGRHVPKYMVPESISFLDSMPKTSSGKIDRQALQNHPSLRPAAAAATTTTTT